MAAHEQDRLVRSAIAGVHHLYVEMIPFAVQFDQIPLMAGFIGSSFAAWTYRLSIPAASNKATMPRAYPEHCASP